MFLTYEQDNWEERFLKVDFKTAIVLEFLFVVSYRLKENLTRLMRFTTPARRPTNDVKTEISDENTRGFLNLSS